MKEDTRELLSFSVPGLEKDPVSTRPGEGLHGNLAMPAPCSQGSSLQNCEELDFCYGSYLAHSVLLR